MFKILKESCQSRFLYLETVPSEITSKVKDPRVNNY